MWSAFSNRAWNRCRCYRRGNFLNICVIVVVIFAYTTNTFFGKTNFNAPFMHYYFNDLFAMPFILGYTNLLILWVGGRDLYFSTPLRIGCLTVFCVVIWEGFAPMFLSNSTRDMLDIIAYAFGSFGYFMLVFLTGRRDRNLFAKPLISIENDIAR